jgi:N-acetylglucosaminyldiphosphoundecaprenol N-acetyl-beta-D-mannosaminyltransferase
MRAEGKRNVLGVLVDIVDYEAAVDRILAAARDRTPLAATALAVHGVMTGVQDPVQRRRLNELDLVTPDGQAVRWGLNLLHRARLRDRVCGPDLTRKLLARAATDGVPVFFYGSTPDVLDKLVTGTQARNPGLQVAGVSPSRFATVDETGLAEIAATVKNSGARLMFAGLGCPRQETFARAIRDHLDVPVLAVGAAFDFEAGTQREGPDWVQRIGLHWLWRLLAEPRRLWRRYLLLNPAYLTLLAAQRLRLWRPSTDGRPADPPVQIPA